jgi:hypothetical protein
MADTILNQLVINECSTIPDSFEPNQLYLAQDTTDKDIANSLNEAKRYADEKVGVVSSELSEYAKKSEIPVNDIQSNGTSLLVDGVANIPIATSNTLGLVRPVSANGIYVSNTGTLNLSKLSNASLVNKTSNYAILVSQIDLATKVGVTTNTIELTDEEKTNACNWLGALSNNTKYGSSLSYSEDKLQLLDKDGNALGSSIEIKASGGGSSNDLFDHKWADHILNDMSWLRADTFSWQDGTVYTDAYNHLVYDFGNGSVEYDTVGSYTVAYVLSPDGHKICGAEQETTVANIYNESGVAWYYIIDPANQRFKLPRTKYGFTGLRDSVGKYVPESLPNITGKIGYIDSTADRIIGGAFYNDGSNSTGWSRTPGGSQIKNFDASRSSSTYQDNAPVQQRSTQMYLYFYVGQFSQSATEQTAGLTTETLNGKLDIDGGNATQTTKETIVGWGMPDFSAGVSKSKDTWYQAETDGWIVASGQGNTQKAPLHIYFSDTELTDYTKGIDVAGGYLNSTSDLTCRTIVPCPKGIYYYQTAKANALMTFYPCKGVK